MISRYGIAYILKMIINFRFFPRVGMLGGEKSKTKSLAFMTMYTRMH